MCDTQRRLIHTQDSSGATTGWGRSRLQSSASVSAWPAAGPMDFPLADAGERSDLSRQETNQTAAGTRSPELPGNGDAAEAANHQDAQARHGEITDLTSACTCRQEPSSTLREARGVCTVIARFYTHVWVGAGPVAPPDRRRTPARRTSQSSFTIFTWNTLLGFVWIIQASLPSGSA